MSKKNPFDVDTPFGRPLVIARGDVTAERDELEAQRDELLTALEGLLPYLTPVLRSHPVGAPGSPARIEQETRIEVEDRARTAIAKARKGE